MKSKKNIVVTGADGALGIPVISRLLQDGWHVFGIMHREEKKEAFSQKFSDMPGSALSVLVADVTSHEDVLSVFAQIKDLDALVHLAGGFTGAPSFADHDPGVFDRMFDLNTRSTFFLIQAALPILQKRNGGAIVTIGAKPAVHPGNANAVYSASKAALINLTLTAAEEGRPTQVRANVIVPAVIRTEANLQWASSEKETEKWTPPEDIARVISWLVSAEGASVTGTVIPMYHGLKG